jgi:ABC-2 type transport system permease protein
VRIRTPLPTRWSTAGARRLAAVFRKEFRQIARDPLSLGLLIVIPALLLILYGYALSFDVKHIPMGVLDLDSTHESRELLDGLFQNPYFDRKIELTAVPEVDALLARGRVRAVVVVPRGYASTLERGEQARVHVFVDGADANTAGTTVGYITALAARASRKVSVEALTRAGLDPALPGVVPEPRVWFNPNMESARFLVPGLIGLLLMISAVVATSLSIVKEKERETMEQMMVSPLRPAELVLGKTLPYVAVCLATMVLILVLGYFLFGVVVRGSFATLAAATLAFLFAALGMGVLISSVTRSQQVAFQTAIITSLLPSIILSGFVFPIKNMPPVVQVLTHIIVPRYFVAALRAVILKGAPFGVVWESIWPMIVLGVVFNALALARTRKAV